MVKQSLIFIITFTLRVSFIFGQSGTLDASFGNNGIVITDFNTTSDFLSALEIQPDQKILAIGYSHIVSEFLACRYNTDGTLDTGFGKNGFFNATNPQIIICQASALQTDGRIILAGTTPHFIVSTKTDEEDFVLIRLNNNGILDSTFGIFGIVQTDFGGDGIERIGEVLVQNDGKILAAGSGWSDVGGSFYGMVRYETNGQLDTTFGYKGIVLLYEVFIVQSCVLQPDGKILIGGYADLGPAGDFEVRRFESDGSFDNSFGVGGKVSTDLSGQSDYVVDIVVEPDGKIFVSGGANFTTESNDFAFARYNPDGTLDKSYGNSGFEIIHRSISSPLNDMERQPDGKYVLCGGSNYLDGSSHGLLIRINHNGGLDESFGDHGIVTTDIQDYKLGGRDLVIQDNNYIVVGGASVVNSNQDFALARYIVDDVVSTNNQQINSLSFSISPNPCKDFILINVDKGSDAFHCILFDLLGHVVKDETLYSDIEGKFKVDTNLFIDGYYTISLDNGTKKGVGSFVVDK